VYQILIKVSKIVWLGTILLLDFLKLILSLLIVV